MLSNGGVNGPARDGENTGTPWVSVWKPSPAALTESASVPNGPASERAKCPLSLLTGASQP